jgi:mannobiose 2-epimerase
MIQILPVKEQLALFKSELSHELGRILNYWIKNTPDEVHGGFFGRIDNENKVVANAPKGSVLNARILWSFSAAYNLDKNDNCLQPAGRAYQYISNYFIDKEKGGVFWSVDYKGSPLDTKKQVYAIAFTIYALSEYYVASKDKEAKYLAINLYTTLVRHSSDKANTGYLEAFTRDWQPITDLRLSAKDANEKKTMNTHLHVLEAYTNLYRIWPDEGLKSQINILLQNFLEYFINAETHHFNLFFDENWNSKSGLVSFGHDIEATWLLQEAAIIIGDNLVLKKLRKLSIGIAEETIKAVDADGGLYYEYEPADDRLIKEKHWWVQAEAMVGFFNTWQISGDERYLEIGLKNWEFIKNKTLDTKNGEWLWGIDEKGNVMAAEDKIGIWKCPYHNSRACIEIINRIRTDK